MYNVRRGEKRRGEGRGWKCLESQKVEPKKSGVCRKYSFWQSRNGRPEPRRKWSPWTNKSEMHFPSPSIFPFLFEQATHSQVSYLPLAYSIHREKFLLLRLPLFILPQVQSQYQSSGGERQRS